MAIVSKTDQETQRFVFEASEWKQFSRFQDVLDSSLFQPKAFNQCLMKESLSMLDKLFSNKIIYLSDNALLVADENVTSTEDR